jgi:phosphatidylserine decarboxylase
MDIYYIERKTGEKVKEVVAGDQFLRWIYDTRMGKTILETFVKRKVFSSIYGRMQDISFSKKKIGDFVEKLSIDMGQAERENIDDYKNFNDFFARKLKKEARPISMEKEHLISPADGRVFAYENIHKDGVIQVKGSTYT